MELVSSHKGLYPSYNDSVDEMDPQTQEVASYTHFSLEHCEGTCSKHPTDEDSSPVKQ
jgi:hypothetical protein